MKKFKTAIASGAAMIVVLAGLGVGVMLMGVALVLGALFLVALRLGAWSEGALHSDISGLASGIDQTAPGAQPKEQDVALATA